MKIFGILLFFAFSMYLTPMKAQNQQKLSSKCPTDKKIYINPETISFGNEGILWEANPNTWIPIASIHSDSQGIYILGSGISWTYYICRSCGKRYKSQPSKCDICGGTDFDAEYEDNWDRKS